MDYPDKVFQYLNNLPHGCTVSLSNLKEPNRFACAVNYLVYCGYISNLEYGVSDNWKKIRKYKVL